MPKVWIVVLVLLLVAVPCRAQSVVMISGGGSEGDIGDTTSWSYRLYRHLLDAGDVNGDGRVTVAVLASSSQSDFIPNYFEWLGANDAFNVIVSSRAQADNPAVVDGVRSVDAIFIKGGDQGEYYDLWNGTRLEANLRHVAQTLNGAIGGTSAGAMSQAQYALAGEQDLISLDVLTNAQTRYLDDADGGSGIHADFLGFVAGTVIDSHFNDRGRLARLLGTLARAAQDFNRTDLLGIGLGDKTGAVIKNQIAEVIGQGSVSFLQQTPETVIHRPAGAPLYMTNVRSDVLTEGGRFDLASRTVAQLPPGAVPVVYPGDGPANLGSLSIRGDALNQQRSYAFTATYAPKGYALVPTSASPNIYSSIGINDSQDPDRRGAIQETILRALYDRPETTGILLSEGGKLSRSSTKPDLLSFGASPGAPESAAVLFDGKRLEAKALSPYTAPADSGNNSLQAAALVNLRIHVIGQTSTWGTVYNSRTHALQQQ